MITNWPSILYPLFEICDAARVSLKLNHEHGHKVHLFGLWSATILNCHAGNLLSHLLRGKPALDAFNNVTYIALVSFIFLLIRFTPGKLVEKFLRIPPIEVTSIMLCEVFRSHKILKGINEGQLAYPGTFWPSILIGSIRGNGSGWMKPIRAIILNDPSSVFKSEWHSPSSGARLAILSAILLTFSNQDPFIFNSLVGLLVSIELRNAYA
uniref:Trimeric intracellular cation channel type A n=1 Tax=Caligus clemensi TaxID=344056 RepID=C1C2E5_CALCM|nr:Trimeric intracellular cation channel type A [Caligus clemensi]